MAGLRGGYLVGRNASVLIRNSVRLWRKGAVQAAQRVSCDRAAVVRNEHQRGLAGAHLFGGPVDILLLTLSLGG